MSIWVLSARSEFNLVGVNSQLVQVARKALGWSDVDFAVTDGVRTLEEQRALVAAGASRTMESKHLTGDAIDLVPFVGDNLRWEMPVICTMAAAVRAAAVDLGVKLRWGGAWDLEFTATIGAPIDIVDGYTKRRLANNRTVFIDGPHFELIGE